MSDTPNGKPDPPKGAGPGEKKHDGTERADRHALTTIPPVQTGHATWEGGILPRLRRSLARGEKSEDHITPALVATVSKTPKTESTETDSEDPSPTGTEMSPLKTHWSTVVKGTSDAWKKSEPARERISLARQTAANPAARKWNGVWSAVASWLISFEVFLALYDRIVYFGGSLLDFMPRASYLHAGGEATAWGFLHGPGRWVMEVRGAAWESDQSGRFLIAVAMGLVPLVAAHAADRLPVKTRARRVVMSLIYGVPMFWISMTFYFPSFGYKAWWEIQLTALTALAWWAWRISKDKETGFRTFVLRIPMAALLTGVVAYSPGAAF